MRRPTRPQALPEDALTVEDRITRDMLQLVAELAIEARRPRRVTRSARSTRSTARRRCCPQLATFQQADTPERLERVARPAPRLRVVHGRAHRDPRRRPALGPDVGPDRRRADDRPARAARRHADRGGDRPGHVEGRRRTRTASACARSCATSSTRPTGGYLEALSGEYLAATREQPGLVSAPDGDDALPLLHPSAGRRSTSSRATSTRSGSTSSPRSTTSGGRSRACRGFGDDVDGVPRAGSWPIRPTRRATVEELVARANEDIERAAAEVAPRVFGRAPAGRLRGRPVEPFKEKDAPFAYYFPPTIDGIAARHLLRQHLRPAEPDATHKLAATTFHEAIPGHHFQIALEMEHPELNVFRRLGARFVARRLRRGLGPVRGAPRRRAGAVPQRRRAARHARRAGVARVAAHRGLRDARPGLVAPAVDRLAAQDRACPRPTRSSRPTATSRGPARRSRT